VSVRVSRIFGGGGGVDGGVVCCEGLLWLCVWFMARGVGVMVVFGGF